ncbi:MAG: Uma2 family endonuclease [Planctomycetes bacterium]|nr:Uma2 family endonuclease [Planctomycetota bacterium]
MGATATDTEPDSIDELLVRLGGISAKRLRYNPPPGRATANDVVRLRNKTRRLYELVDGTLVEKVTGAPESFVAVQVSTLLNVYSAQHGNLGMVLGADGMMTLMKGLVRIPDVSFTNWDRLPDRRVPSDPILDLAPDLAVEVLSEGNTREEMERKLKEYFHSEVRLVWYVDPRKRTVHVYTSPDDATELGAGDTLDGGDVLPGFSVEVDRLFDQLAPVTKPAKPPKSAGGKKPKKRK